MVDSPEAPFGNNRPMPEKEWFDANFRKPNGEPYSERTRKKHLRELGIKPLKVGWTPVVDPALADRIVLEHAAKQNARVIKG